MYCQYKRRMLTHCRLLCRKKKYVNIKTNFHYNECNKSRIPITLRLKYRTKNESNSRNADKLLATMVFNS